MQNVKSTWQVTTTTRDAATKRIGVNMNTLESLAVELALLSNQDVAEVAKIMVKDYPSRADVIETQLGAAFFDSTEQFKEIA